MLKFDYCVDLKKLKLTEQMLEAAMKNELKSQKNVFESTLNALMAGLGGVQGSEARIINRVLNKIDDATGKQIDLEEAELDVLKKFFCSDDTRVAPEILRAYGLLQTKVDDLLLESRK